MINGGYADAEMFAAAISDLLAAGWKLVPPQGVRAVSDDELAAGIGWGNVTDETPGDTPQG